jgi:hypothetical protein
MSLGATLAGCTTGTAEPGCSIGHRGYFARYDLLTSSDPSCGGLKGEWLGVEKFSPETDDGVPKLALRPRDLHVEGATDSPTKNAVGAYTVDTPTADNVCQVPTLTEATAGTKSYTFSNVKFWVTPDAPGNRMTADLTYKVGACTATYRVRVIHPAVECTKRTSANIRMFDSVTGKPVPNPIACAKGDLTATPAVNPSRLNPAFNPECDIDADHAQNRAYCVLPVASIPPELL